MEPSEIWARTCDRVRQEVANPTVWLAMQAAQPLLIDGSFFVAALPKPEEYLAVHLLDHQTNTAIEEALQTVAGRILAFRLIVGNSAADWNAGKSPIETEKPPQALADPLPTVSRPAPSEAKREVSPTWEKLSERLNQGYKTAPFIKYPHGQAQYVRSAVKLISDTMDVLMPPVGALRDDVQERALAKVIERLSGIVNLDALFLALELQRFRELHGKNADLSL